MYTTCITKIELVKKFFQYFFFPKSSIYLHIFKQQKEFLKINFYTRLFDFTFKYEFISLNKHLMHTCK